MSRIPALQRQAADVSFAMNMKSKRSTFFGSETAAAAVESAFVIPFIMLLYMSLQDFTGLVTFNRKITSTASTMSDTIAQYSDTITRQAVTDIFNAVGLTMQPTPDTDVHVDVFGYYMKSGAATLRWQVNNGKGPICTAPDTSNFANLMATGNDLIVAVSCMNYKPFITTFMGDNILGASTFKLNQTVMSRPRGSTTLNCIIATGSTTSCSS